MTVDNQSRPTLLVEIPASELTGGQAYDLDGSGLFISSGDYGSITTNQEEIVIIRKFDDSSLSQGELSADELWEAWTLPNSNASGSPMYSFSGSEITFSETQSDYVLSRAGGDENLPIISASDTVYAIRSIKKNNPIVTFQPASRITSSNLNTAIEQVMYLAQELQDMFHNFDKLSPFFGAPGGVATLDSAGNVSAGQVLVTIEGNTVEGDLTIEEDLTVQGDIQVDGTMTGSISISSVTDMTVTNDLDVQNDLQVDNDATVTGDLTVSGTLNVTNDLDASVTATGSSTSRDLAARFAEFVNVKDYGAEGDDETDDTTAIQNAITDANSAGKDVMFPKGTYKTTSSISNFHNVRKFGVGVVKRDTDLFPVEPRNGDTNALYVTTTGNDTNDGLSSDQPFLTVQEAVDALDGYGPVLRGTWTIELAAGSYAGDVSVNIQSDNRLRIQGPSVTHPTVPTAILDGDIDSGSDKNGINFNRGTFAKVIDIKAQDFTGDQSDGFALNNQCNVYFKNCHADNCGFAGINVNVNSRVYVEGGLFDSNEHGIRLYGASVGTIGAEATQISEGPKVTNSTVGYSIETQSNCHLDFCNGDTNEKHIEVHTFGRCHIKGGEYLNIDTSVPEYGVRAFTGGVYYLNEDISVPVVFKDTTSTDIGYSIKNEGLAGRHGWLKIGRTPLTFFRDAAVDDTHTGSVIEHIMTIGSDFDALTIKKGEMSNPGDVLKVRIAGTRNMAPSTNVTAVRFLINNGISLGWSMEAGNDDFILEGELVAKTSATQKAITSYRVHNGDLATVDLADRTIDFRGSDKTFKIEVQHEDSDDSLTINYVEIVGEF